MNFFSKEYCAEISLNSKGYSNYKCFVKIVAILKGNIINNRFVVPYHLTLLLNYMHVEFTTPCLK